ncbi:crotonase/enoyl-CoA hydratase family protein [Marilutibacter chinensis]|uniref:Enoyl-CoA hydratase-related protein n=1 Tax=Marilutibacter chinensis TaxID=2912247 RepID=A0ABS9HVV8_9GAMM|nr:crotonase/enoyl-CoA hydratase family protein [Lysobacter chinensis]MCF7222408.1 enoyl-CoA hydratase-related protein [Lysobacter chinensis]
MRVTASVSTPLQFAKSPDGGRLNSEIRRLSQPTVWLTFSPDPRTGIHNFTPSVVDEFQQILGEMKQWSGETQGINPSSPGYAVIQSSDPTYFSQGGDLSFFLDCIRRRDARTLHRYSMQCLNVMLQWSTGFVDDVHTISLVQGRALGGGFEMAISSDYVIAEEHSDFAFPEIMFGLFPCTGAMGLITSRCNAFVAERMMTRKRRPYSAQELFELGLVDEICPTGEGEIAVERHIAEHARRRKSRMKIQQSRHRHSALSREEGVRIVDDWVETAMELDADELRSLEMLIMMQRGGLLPEAPKQVA